MSVYGRIHADVYDLIYAGKDYCAEVDFIDRVLSEKGSGDVHHLLDIACGTGSHALMLARKGYSVTGIDSSAEMLAHAKAKSAELALEFHLQDMRELALPGRTFDAAICLFDSIGYLIDNDSIVEALRRVRSHLHPGALFILEFWHAAAMLAHFEPVRIGRWVDGERRVLRIAETTLDQKTQTAEVLYTIIQSGPDGVEISEERQRNRYFLVPEMGVLAGQSGFAPLEWLAGFSSSTPITDATWHVVAVLEAR